MSIVKSTSDSQETNASVEGSSPRTRVRKAVSFSSETQFKEKKSSPPVLITHTTTTKNYVIYGIQIVYRGSKWNIGRRYRHFEDNHKRMVKEGVVPKGDLPKLPKKRSYRSIASWKNKIGRTLTRGSIFGEEYEEYEHERVMERKEDLEKYVTALMANAALVAQSAALRRFLEISESTLLYYPVPVDANEFTPFVERSSSNFSGCGNGHGSSGGRSRNLAAECTGDMERSTADFDRSNAERFDREVPALSAESEDGTASADSSGDDDDDSLDNDATASSVDSSTVSVSDTSDGASLMGGTDGDDVSAFSTAMEANTFRLTHVLTKTYVTYNIEFNFFGQYWTVSRRYSQFARFHGLLKREGIVSQLPHLPKKHVLAKLKFTFSKVLPTKATKRLSSDGSLGAGDKRGAELPPTPQSPPSSPALGKVDGAAEENVAVGRHLAARLEELERYISTLFGQSELVSTSRAMREFFEFPVTPPGQGNSTAGGELSIEDINISDDSSADVIVAKPPTTGIDVCDI